MRKEDQLPPRAVPPSGQAGFTIIELMVAIALFLIVTASIYGLLEVARADRATTNQRVQLMQNLRVALNMIGRDALNAGYRYPQNGVLLPNNVLMTQLGIPADGDPSRDILMPVVSGNNLRTNSVNPDAAARTDQISFVFRDPAFNVVTRTVAGNTVQRSEDVRVWTEEGSGSARAVIAPPPAQPTPTPAPTTNGVAAKNDLVVLTKDNSSAMAVVTDLAGVTSNKVPFVTGDLLGINKAWNASNPLEPMKTASTTSPAATASLAKVGWVTYLVLNDGTLVRRVHGNNPTATAASEDQPLAYGIQDMQIEYVMEDGTTHPNPTGVGIVDNVRQVRVTLVARGTELERRSRQPHVIRLSATFSTRNLGFNP